MQLIEPTRKPTSPVVLAAFDRTHWVWMHEVAPFFERLGRQGDEALHWQLGRGRTIGRILLHIGSVLGYYQDALHQGLGDRVPALAWRGQDLRGDAQQRHRMTGEASSVGEEWWRGYYDEAYYVRHDRPWYEHLLEEAYTNYMAAIPGIRDEDLQVICTTMSGKQGTVEWILHQVPGHTDYHIGQVNYILGRFEETQIPS